MDAIHAKANNMLDQMGEKVEKEPEPAKEEKLFDFMDVIHAKAQSMLDEIEKTHEEDESTVETQQDMTMPVIPGKDAEQMRK